MTPDEQYNHGTREIIKFMEWLRHRNPERFATLRDELARQSHIDPEQLIPQRRYRTD